MSKPMSVIYELHEKGNIERKAIYALEPKKALICYIRQQQNDHNTWEYPENIKGIRESQIAPNHFYYEQPNTVLAAYPYKAL